MSIGETMIRFESVMPRSRNGVNIGGGGFSSEPLPGWVHLDPPVMTMNPDPATPTEITLEMAADDGHKFWLGELNMALALAKNRVKVSGPISKIMKLLPAMRPAFPKYKVFLEERGGVG